LFGLEQDIIDAANPATDQWCDRLRSLCAHSGGGHFENMLCNYIYMIDRTLCETDNVI